MIESSAPFSVCFPTFILAGGFLPCLPRFPKRSLPVPFIFPAVLGERAVIAESGRAAPPPFRPVVITSRRAAPPPPLPPLTSVGRRLARRDIITRLLVPTWVEDSIPGTACVKTPPKSTAAKQQKTSAIRSELPIQALRANRRRRRVCWNTCFFQSRSHPFGPRSLSILLDCSSVSGISSIQHVPRGKRFSRAVRRRCRRTTAEIIKGASGK